MPGERTVGEVGVDFTGNVKPLQQAAEQAKATVKAAAVQMQAEAGTAQGAAKHIAPPGSGLGGVTPSTQRFADKLNSEETGGIADTARGLRSASRLVRGILIPITVAIAAFKLGKKAAEEFINVFESGATKAERFAEALDYSKPQESIDATQKKIDELNKALGQNASAGRSAGDSLQWFFNQFSGKRTSQIEEERQKLEKLNQALTQIQVAKLARSREERAKELNFDASKSERDAEMSHLKGMARIKAEERASEAEFDEKQRKLGPQDDAGRAALDRERMAARKKFKEDEYAELDRQNDAINKASDDAVASELRGIQRIEQEGRNAQTALARSRRGEDEYTTKRMSEGLAKENAQAVSDAEREERERRREADAKVQIDLASGQSRLDLERADELAKIMAERFGLNSPLEKAVTEALIRAGNAAADVVAKKFQLELQKSFDQIGADAIGGNTSLVDSINNFADIVRVMSQNVRSSSY